MRIKSALAALAAAATLLVATAVFTPVKAMGPVGPSASGKAESSLIAEVRHRRWYRRDAYYYYPRRFHYRPYYYSYAPSYYYAPYYRPYYGAYYDPYYRPYYGPRYYGYGYGFYGPRVGIRIGF